MSARRWYAPVVLTLLAAGGLTFLAGSRTWAEATVEAAGLPGDTVAVTGSDAVPLVPALALVVVTGALAVLASAGRVRRAVGVVVAAAALGGVVLTLGGSDTVGAALDDAVRSSPAFTGSNEPDVVVQSVWRLVASGAFALALVLGAVVTVVGARWPSMSRRYESPAAPSREPQHEQDLWKAMDEGRDPTQ